MVAISRSHGRNGALCLRLTILGPASLDQERELLSTSHCKVILEQLNGQIEEGRGCAASSLPMLERVDAE